MAANKTLEKTLKWVCFLAYLLLLIYLLFFAEFLGRTERTGEYRYNLTLFQEIMRYHNVIERTGSWHLFLKNVVANIILFVPFGFYVPMLFKRGMNLFFTILLSLELSLIVEVLQLVTRVGSFDVDDLLLNTIGGLCGYILYMVMYGFKKIKAMRRK